MPGLIVFPKLETNKADALTEQQRLKEIERITTEGAKRLDGRPTPPMDAGRPNLKAPYLNPEQQMSHFRQATPEENQRAETLLEGLMPRLKAQAEADPTHPSRWYWGLSMTPQTEANQSEQAEPKP